MDRAQRRTRAVSSLLHISAEATVAWGPRGLSIQAAEPQFQVTAELRFREFQPRLAGSLIGEVDLHDFYYTIRTCTRDEEVSYEVDVPGQIWNLIFTGPHGVRTQEVPFDFPPWNYFDTTAINFDEYGLRVGIESQLFQGILTDLEAFHDRDIVTATVFANQVIFTSAAGELIQEQERGLCVIEGMEGIFPEEIAFTEYGTLAYLEASELCHTVWMLHSPVRHGPDVLFFAAGFWPGGPGDIFFFQV